MLAKILIITGLAAAGLLFVVINTTSPSQGGAAAILAVFLLSYIVAISCLSFCLLFVSTVIQRFYNATSKKKTQSLSLKKAYYYSTVIALAPVIIISLQSVGEVGIYDLCLVGLFVLLGCVYVARRSGT